MNSEAAADTTLKGEASKGCLAADTMLSHYRIISRLGAGGMGEVYLAEDTLLNRKVALKILPMQLAADHERMSRFTQEARAAASLNHPNIAQIYEVGASDGTPFIAMEYVDGVTLRDTMNVEQVSLRTLLRYLQHSAEALARAHTSGIIHRDLKPENIMVTVDGFAKVLDFGLAKLLEPSTRGAQSSADVSTIVSPPLSTPGTIMGTVGYMSPEQAQGKTADVDQRSDIFSFGCLLYEAATRHRAFQGENTLDTLHKTMHAAPQPISELNPDAPEELSRIVRRCLAKNPEKRYQSIKDIALELEDLRDAMKTAEKSDTAPLPQRIATAPLNHADANLDPTEPAKPIAAALPGETNKGALVKPRRNKLFATLGVAVAVLVIAVIAGYLIPQYKVRQPGVEKLSFSSGTIARLTDSGKVVKAAISKDGKWLVHVVNDDEQQSLWLRQVAIPNSNAQIVAPSPTEYLGVTISPDGNYVYYTAIDDDGSIGSLYQIPVLGGPARKLFTGCNSAVDFSPDGRHIAYISYVGDEDRLMIANADGSGQRLLAGRHGNESFVSGTNGPAWSPDGKMIVTPISKLNPQFMSVAAVSVESGQMTFFCPRRFQNVSDIEWFNDGKRVLVSANEHVNSSGGIWQITYPSGDVHRITNDLNNYSTISLTADSNTLAMVQEEGAKNIWIGPLADTAHGGQITTGRHCSHWPALAPDGKVIYASNAGGNYDLYSVDARGGSARQLTASSGSNVAPAISPDGRHIVFTSDRTGVFALWRMNIDGADAKQLTEGSSSDVATFTPDSQTIVYSANANKSTLWKVAINGGPARQLTETESLRPALSPDGTQILCIYQARQDGPFHLAILPAAGGAPLKLFPYPKGFSANLRWMPNGKGALHLITRSGITNVWMQPVDGSAARQMTQFTSERIFWFDISRDGKQLVASRGSSSSDVVLVSGFR